jgi:Rad3-related DNA helicase
MVEGVDFPGDDIRFQIIAKVPFASSTDPVFKMRCKQDPSYRFECAALLIVQMCGRGMRSVSDWVETAVVDEHFGYLRWRAGWPKWFKDAWQEWESLPPPLKLAA